MKATSIKGKQCDDAILSQKEKNESLKKRNNKEKKKELKKERKEKNEGKNLKDNKNK